MPENVTFMSDHTRCRAWHFAARTDTLSTTHGAPCVVMAHGFSATADSGLMQYAHALSTAGVDVLVFDYRGFGANAAEGAPAASVHPSRQQADYRAAIAFARSLPGVDPDRIIIWGVSLSGGHAIAVAATDPRIAAVIALTPAVDGPAAIKMVLQRAPKTAARLAAAGFADLGAALRHRPAVTVPAVGEPDSAAPLSAPGAASGYAAMAGPSAVNAVPARSVLRVAAYRPARMAARIRTPVLFQIADNDQSAPPAPARKAAFACRAEVRHYPCDHFDIYPAGDWFDAAVAHQIHFLRRHFDPASSHAPVVPLVVTK